MKGSLLMLFGVLAMPCLADPYRYYGGDIDAPEKSPEVEACEYRALVEEQRCNERINKSECIREIYRECLKLLEKRDDAAGNEDEAKEDLD